jgi:hypothetical protein
VESRERSEPAAEDREQGTPQGQLLDEGPRSESDAARGDDPQQEGGADSAADAAGEGG